MRNVPFPWTRFGSGSVVGASFAHNFDGLAIAVLGIGFGYSLDHPCDQQDNHQLVLEKQRGSVMGLKQTGTTVGASIAGALLPVIGVSYGLSASFISAAKSVLIGSFFLIGYKESATPSNTKKGFAFLREGLRVSAKNRNLLAVGCVGFFYASVQGAVTTYIALFAQITLG